MRPEELVPLAEATLAQWQLLYRLADWDITVTVVNPTAVPHDCLAQTAVHWMHHQAIIHVPADVMARLGTPIDAEAAITAVIRHELGHLLGQPLATQLVDAVIAVAGSETLGGRLILALLQQYDELLIASYERILTTCTGSLPSDDGAVEPAAP